MAIKEMNSVGKENTMFKNQQSQKEFKFIWLAISSRTGKKYLSMSYGSISCTTACSSGYFNKLH